MCYGDVSNGTLRGGGDAEATSAFQEPRALPWRMLDSSERRVRARGGHSDFELAGPKLRAAAVAAYGALPLRGEASLEISDRNLKLTMPGAPVFVEDRGCTDQCFHPALAFCTGDRGAIPGAIRAILKAPTVGEMNNAMKGFMLQLRPDLNGFLDVLKETQGMFMLLGKSGCFLYWLGYDAWRGVLYPGKGIMRIIGSSELRPRMTAAAVFSSLGMDDVRHVYITKTVLPKRKRKRVT